LASVLPFDSSSATGKEVIASGMEKIRFSSDIVSGAVSVSVRKARPVKSVSLLLGNELAGGQVVALPKVVPQSVTISVNELVNEDIP
jgi:hypothetical protein